MNFGVQTFTIRKHQKKDIPGSYRPLSEMGITHLEIARIKFNRENALKVKSATEEQGIVPVSLQVKPKDVFGHMDDVVEFCNITGCKNVVISQLPFDCILGEEEKFYSFISTLDSWFDKYAERGITLAYHHHNWEYIRLSNGKTRMAELLSKTERIKFVHDTYWTARSGVSPDDQIREFGERLLGIHLRDLAFKKKLLDVIPHDTSVGDGVIDFTRVLRAAEEVGCEYTVIEQKTSDPYGDIQKSFSYLQKINSQSEE